MLHGLLVQIEGQCGEFGGVMCVRVCVPGDVSNRLPDVIRWMKGGGSVRTNNKRGRGVTREHS